MADQSALVKSQFGTVLFSISAGENGAGLSQSEEYYIQVDFPRKVVPKPPKLRTKECKINNISWSCSETIKFVDRMEESMNITFHLMEYHYINDKKVGEGRISFGSTLFTGRPFENMSVDLMSSGEDAKKLATVCCSLCWENDSPPNYLAIDTTTSDSANTMIKQNLRNEVAELSKLPECEGRDYTIRVKIHKARNLQSEEEDTRYDPLVVVKVNKDATSTEYSPKTNNPIFDEEMVFTFTKVDANFWSTPIVFNVMDHHIAMPNTKIGLAQLDCASVYRANVSHFMQNKWVVLRKDMTTGHVMGFLKISVAVLDAHKDPIPEPDEEDEHEDDEDNIVMNLVASPGAQFENIFLHCDVIRAEDLPEMDAFNTPNLFKVAGELTGSSKVKEQNNGKVDRQLCDPYVKFRFGTKTITTPTKKSTQMPVWNCAVNLPMSLPTLSDSIFMQLYDSDTMSDEIIATKIFSFNKLLSYGRAGLPAMSARWINLYGAPRNTHQSTRMNSYFEKMDKGTKEGADYRGRILVRFNGTREKKPAQNVTVPVKETVVSVTALVQALQFTMIPKGSYKIVAWMGSYKAESRVRSGDPMVGESTNLRSIFFGEELCIKGDFSVIVPQDPDVDASVADQLPDIIVHLVDGSNVFAVNRYPASQLLGKSEAPYFCQTMKVLVDPSKTKEGEQPTEPLAQVYAGMFIRKSEPDVPEIPKASSLVMQAINSDPPHRFILETCVYQARQLPAGDSNGLSDPFVRISWANSTAQTGTKLETLNPIYDELVRCVADAKPGFPDIVVEVWDWDMFGSNTFLAKTIVPFEAATNNAGQLAWYDNFTCSQGKKLESCQLLLSFEVRKLMKDHDEPPQMVRFPKKVGSKDTYKGYPIPMDKVLPKTIYNIKVDVMSLRRMRRFRMMDIKCPSVEVELAGHCVKIQKVYGANPDFNKEFALQLELPEDPRYLPMVNIRVYDNRIGTKTLIGCAVVPIDSLKYNPTQKELNKRKADEAVAHRLAKINEFKGVSKARGRGTTVVKSKALTAGLKSLGKAVILQNKVKKQNEPINESASVNDDDNDLSAPFVEAPEVHVQANGDSPPEAERIEMGAPDANAEPAAAEPTRPADPAQHNADQAYDELEDILSKNFITEEEKQAAAEESADEADDTDPLWFNRFDPEGFKVKPAMQVSRLGKVKGVLPAGYTTAEQYFGPFDDIGELLTLRRGWGHKSIKSGEMYFDMSVMRMGKAEAAKATVTQGEPKQDHIRSRGEVKFMARIYVLSCNNLTAMDHSILGNKSDPYLVLTLTNDSTDEDVRRVSCKKEKKFQTLNPEFFLMREMEGVLPKHNTLRISVYDYDRIGSDEIIGFTDINLEQRWFSSRGYSHRSKSALTPGSYTEKRMLRNKIGQQQGSIEMWIDMFSVDYSIVPRPIDITPPPPIELELRCIVWNTRDVVLQDVSVHGEAMTDIYVRGWLDGMTHDVQNTDVHYRSLDGSGNFNWRMIFPFVFEPRTRRIMPVNSKSTEAGFFHIRREQKKYDPVLKMQIFDNDFFPGTDDFIGEINLNLLRLKPISKRRNLEHLLEMMMKDLTATVCCCCKKKLDPEELSLEEKQQMAKEEFDQDVAYQRKKWEYDADQRVQALRQTGQYTEDQLRNFRQDFIKEYRKKSMINLFDKYLPHAKSKNPSGIGAAGGAANAPAENPDSGLSGEQEAAATGATKKVVFDDDYPVQVETPKYWFTCRGPKGAGRVGDIQMSFQLVRTEAINDDKKLQAGKGRADPNALPDPNRPASSFFWLSSPYKAAIHILWKNYKWYILGILVLIVSALMLYLFFSEGVQIRAKKFFEGESGQTTVHASAPTVNVYVPTPAPNTTK